MGVGAPFLDHVIKVSQAYLDTIDGEKGGMQPVDYATFRRIIDESGVPVNLATGGSSSNTIKGLANLGHACALVGKLGTDEAGQTFINGIQKLGITSFIANHNNADRAVGLHRRTRWRKDLQRLFWSQ